MNCGEVEILLADYVEETLPGEAKSAVEAHLAQCAMCSELARDAAAAVAFMERTAEIDAPPELVTKLLFEVTQGPSRSVVRPSLGRRMVEAVFGSWLGKVLEPRYAMSMAMTVLSLAMIFRSAGISPRQLTVTDLDPVKVWTLAENRVTRVWERGVKYYDSLRVVFEIQAQLREWSAEDPAGDAGADGLAEVPAVSAPAASVPAASAPTTSAPTTSGGVHSK
jgi:hypothetical protein